MCPLISPASGAFSSLIFCLISEWPVRHMIGLPPSLCDLVVEDLGGLDLGDDGRAGPRRQDVPGEDDEELVAPDDPPFVVDDADPVGVAVVADAELGAALPDLGDELLHGLGQRRVRVVVGKAAVRLGEDVDDLGAHPPEQGHGHDPARAVAGVDDDLDRPGEADVPGDVILVFGDDVERRHAAVAAREDALADDLVERLDRLAVERIVAGHHLEAVVLGRIVRAGDHDPGRHASYGRPRSKGAASERRRAP